MRAQHPFLSKSVVVARPGNNRRGAPVVAGRMGKPLHRYRILRNWSSEVTYALAPLSMYVR